MTLSRVSSALLLATGVTALAPALAAESDWPQRPIQIVVPFQAGSATDLISRQLGSALGRELNQSVVVENRPGAAAAIGSTQVARAKPDGYTLLMSGPASMVTNALMMPNLSYDPESFEKIALVAQTPNVLLSSPAMPFKTLQEMVAYAKENPGKLSYASFGTGTTSHLAGELLKQQAGIDLLHVPYKGAGEAIPALRGGQVSMYFDTIMTALPQISAGALNALAISTAERSEMAPDIPTVAEQGYPGFDIAPWYGLVAPGGTPPEVIEKLSAAVQKIVKDPEFQAQLAKTGAEILPADLAAFESLIEAERPRTQALIEQSGVKQN